MENFLKITKERLKNHMHYGKWYYIGAVIIVVVIINMAYTVTAPRYPKESTVSIMMYAGIVDEDASEVWEKEMLELLSEDQREVEINSTVSIDENTQVVVFARITAKEDDILVMDIENIESYANQAAFLPLDEYMDMDIIYSMYPDVDLSEYWMKADALDSDETHIYWLPLAMVEGFDEIGFSGEKLGIGVIANSENAENAIICLEYLITK